MAYIELSIGSLIKFFSDELSFDHTLVDSIDTAFAYFYLVILPLVPTLLLLVLTLKEKVIREKGPLFRKLEELFLDVHLDTWQSINYITIYIIRRMTLVFFIMVLDDDSTSVF
jgi:hypothetical protein